MATPLRRAKRWRAATGVDRWAWGPILLAVASVLIGALFQDPVRYGWVAGAAAAMLLVHMAVRFAPAQPPDPAAPRPVSSLRPWLTVLIHLALLGAITYAIADAIEMTRGAASAGNEALWIATAWGLYGLVLVLTTPLVAPDLPWLTVGQVALALGLGFLLMGGLMANARWADAPVRFAAYAGVVGAAWLAAWVQDRRGRLTEIDRLLALAAAAIAFGICSFEAMRYLEPRFTYPKGTLVTPAMLARNHRLLNTVSLALWSTYCLLLLGAGALLRSPLARSLGLTLGLSVLLYLLVDLVI